MNLEIVNTEKMSHLEREEITASITYKGETPSRKEVRKAIADKQGADKDLVFVRNIYTSFGESKAKVLACVYSSKKAMENVEQNAMIEKHVEQDSGNETSSEEAAGDDSEEAPEESKDESDEKEEDSDESEGDDEDDSSSKAASDEEKE